MRTGARDPARRAGFKGDGFANTARVAENDRCARRAGVWMKTLLVLLLLLPPCLAARAETEVAVVAPYEAGRGFEPAGALDRLVLATLETRGIVPANPCSDAVFVRRVFLDVTGTLPDPAEIRAFSRDRRPDRRARLIDDLLERDTYVDTWTLKWGDILRIKAEFPIKLWPNGVHVYHRWLHDAIRSNMPYDEFARALLTSSGSNFRVAPVNFYRAVQDRSPSGIAAAVALTFLGERFEAWPEAKRTGFAAFFQHVTYKPTAEWKEEIVIHDPAPTPAFDAVLPNGLPVTIPADTDPRGVFVRWLLAKDNPCFARAIANRVWSWLMGRGIVHEPDDLRPDNPPSNPPLLSYLERELVSADYDLKHLFRLILNSRTYQASPIPQSDHPEAAALFASYPVRRLDAEVLIDALCRLDGKGEDYLSIVPEPFTILPDTQRSIRLADGTITSPFLQMFGRPARDTGLESERDNAPTDAQRLHLLNSTDVYNRIQRSAWLRRLIQSSRRRPLDVIRPIYVGILSRDPTTEEVAIAATYFQGPNRNGRDAAVDLTWALINSKEFLYRH